MVEFLKYMQKEWDVVSSAPVTIGIITILIWGCVHMLYKGLFKRSKEIRSLQESQINLIQGTMGASSVEEVVERLGSLEAELREAGETDLAAIFIEAD